MAEQAAQQAQAMAAMKAEQDKRDFERRTKERERKIEEGKKKAKDLEARYGQWFYVVSNADAMKIRLDRAAFIKKPEPNKDGAAQPGLAIGGNSRPEGSPRGNYTRELNPPATPPEQTKTETPAAPTAPKAEPAPAAMEGRGSRGVEKTLG